ncbi:MAG: ABC transporter ATP-binding protein [Acidimicrobiia bacterium]
MAAAVEVEALCKHFRLHRERHKSVKERVLHPRRSPFEVFRALDDITLDIEAGHTVGMLGHNGSGKSTLLKCMAGIIQPTSGALRTTGRLAALLELGAGFHPDLTGRENVYLNGSILGLRRVEVDRVLDDIVAFAGLEPFIDIPVKQYSSGMYVRLGFAVAINVDPEILLVDEVLSVGDESFQRKCIDKVKSFQAEGRTIVVVTHNADLVRQMCDRAAALDHGRLVATGDPNQVIRVFRQRLMAADEAAEGGDDHQKGADELSPVWGRVRLTEATIRYPAPGADHLRPGEPLRFEVDIDVPGGPVDDVVVGIAIYSSAGHLVYGTNTDICGLDLGTVNGPRRVSFCFDEAPLLDGHYRVTVGAHTRNGLIYDHWEQQRHFTVVVAGRNIGVVNLPVHVEVEGG